MVIGQKISDKKSNSLTKLDIKELSIQIDLSGLSFCILNRTENTIEYLKSVAFEKPLTPYQLLDKIKEIMASDTVFSDEFSSVNIIHQNELSTLVPKALFNEDNSADYLKFNSKILKTDFVSYDVIAINESINVYVPYVNINNYIFDTFGSFIYRHASTIFLDTILQLEKDSKQKRVYINVESTTFKIAVIENGVLLLYNTFDYATTADFIYFVLFTFEQLQLDPEIVPIVLSGFIAEDDDNYAIIYKYIRHVKLIQQSLRFKVLKNIDNTKLNKEFLLTNSF